MQTDRYGHALATDSEAAATALQAAFDGYVAWRTDIMANLDAAIAADPGFALAHAAKGILMVGMRKPELYPQIDFALAAARNGRPPVSERERRYIGALEAALAGQITAAANQFEQICRAHPHDLFALRLAQFELFWLGEMAWSRDIGERAAAHWNDEMPGYGPFLSIRAFNLEETGAYGEAEAFGREAVARDPNDCWGTHAVAHVLIMQGRLADGIDWVSGLSGNWDAANHIRHHLWWHLALFQVEAGDFDGALAVYDRRLRDPDSDLLRAVPDYYVDLQNDVALLQRLELRGVDVGARWGEIADLCAARIGNHANAFTSAHCALALAAAGRLAEAEDLVARIRDFIAGDASALGPRYALAGLPAAAAAIAYRKGEHEAVLDLLLPARRNLWQMGGSHAQRDLFFQLLADSAFRLGRGDVLALLLDELGAIGFDHLAERTSYADAIASLH